MVHRSEILWASFVLACLCSLVAYEGRAGEPARPPERFPAILQRGPELTLVVMAHPQCPCTRATLEQLRLLSRPSLKTYVIFVRPPGTGADFHLGELYTMALALPNVTTLIDDDGRLSQLFGSYTSGQALLYGAAGELRFAGGLTASRGHVGPSVGLESVEQNMARKPGATAADVFGCPLLSEEESLCHP